MWRILEQVFDNLDRIDDYFPLQDVQDVTKQIFDNLDKIYEYFPLKRTIGQDCKVWRGLKQVFDNLVKIDEWTPLQRINILRSKCLIISIGLMNIFLSRKDKWSSSTCSVETAATF